MRAERGLTAQYYLAHNTLGSKEKVRKHLRQYQYGAVAALMHFILQRNTVLHRKTPPSSLCFPAQFYSASVFALTRTVESDALLMRMCNVDNDGCPLAWFQLVLDSNVRAILWTCSPRKKVCVEHILKRRVLRRSYPPSYLALPGWHF